MTVLRGFDINDKKKIKKCRGYDSLTGHSWTW